MTVNPGPFDGPVRIWSSFERARIIPSIFPIYQPGARLPFIPSRTGRSADAPSMAGKQLQGCERER